MLGLGTWLSMEKNRDIVDRRFYINVKELTYKQLPRPNLKRKIFVCDGEWLPLITLEIQNAEI